MLDICLRTLINVKLISYNNNFFPFNFSNIFYVRKLSIMGRKIYISPPPPSEIYSLRFPKGIPCYYLQTVLCSIVQLFFYIILVFEKDLFCSISVLIFVFYNSKFGGTSHKIKIQDSDFL